MNLRAIPRVAIVHPTLSVGAGSEAVPVWLAMALKDVARVTLITMGAIDLAILNKFFGTSLDLRTVDLVSIPRLRWMKSGFAALQGFPLHRYCRMHVNDHDVWISTYNVMNFGGPGLQFIADFSFDDELRREFDNVAPGVKAFWYRRSPLRSAYLGLSHLLSGRIKKGWRNNLTVANSVWSQKVLRERCGLDSSVIYPPVVGRFPDTPWKDRHNGFVVLGRLNPEKNLERVIAIISRVRHQGFDVHLHILGRIEDNPYVKRIVRLCQKNQEWAFMEGLKGGAEKDKFLSSHKFGLSGRQHEPFGIAVGEMVKARCLVWVPQGGGQTEIVEHPQLTFRDDDEAVDKITTILKSNSLQDTLRAHLASQAGKFSQERFMTEARSLFVRFLEG
jgi:glycosyltransferase involved in cell wall biosynthesis